MTKSGEQIIAHIKSQYWGVYFFNNLKGKSLRFISKKGCEKWVVRAAFNWEETEQGTKFWELANKEFLAWLEK